MVSKTVKFKDFDGNEIEKTLHFHISKADMIEMDLLYEDGLEAHLKKVREMDEESIEARALLIDITKTFLSWGYGERKEGDSITFIKDPMMRTNFQHTPMYEAILFDFVEKEEDVLEFVHKMMPSNMTLEELMQAIEADKKPAKKKTTKKTTAKKTTK